MENQPSFKQSLGLVDATMLVAGSMIGSGIFIVSADMGRTVGSPGYLLLAWILSGILTTIAALSYGELAGMMPRAGGQYVYLREAYNPLIGFLFGWTQFLVIQTGTIAAVAVAFAKFSSVFFPFFSPENVLLRLGPISVSAAQLLAISCIVILTYFHTRGIQGGKTLQTTFTAAKLVALFGLIVLGFALGFKTEIWHQNWQDGWRAGNWNSAGVFTAITTFGLVTAMGTAMVGSLFSSDAWNNVTFIAGEIKNPRRNIPLSLLLGTFTVSTLYILTNIVYFGAIPFAGDPQGADDMARGIIYATNDRVGTAVSSVIFGAGGALIMTGLIVLSTFGCANGLILSGARLGYAMAKDDLFVRQAGTLNKNGVPAWALYAQLIWTAILCLSGTYGALLDYTIFAALLFYVLTVAGIFLLRRKQPDAERPYKAFGYPIVPALYILAASTIALILLFYKSENTIPGLIIVLLGIPVYYWQQRKK